MDFSKDYVGTFNGISCAEIDGELYYAYTPPQKMTLGMHIDSILEKPFLVRLRNLLAMFGLLEIMFGLLKILYKLCETLFG